MKVGLLSQLTPGSVFEATRGEERYAICNVEGRIHALSGTCPHHGGPLGQGAVNGSSLTCPWHAWEFDCRLEIDDGLQPSKFPVKLDGDDILIDVP